MAAAHQSAANTVEEFIKITTSLSTERDLNTLLNMIVSSARSLTGAEAGRVYILDETKRNLILDVCQNDVVGDHKESLPLVADKLQAFGLKERIKLIASGKLITPAEAAMALCMGADFINSARGYMFSLGCIQALQCNRNTCPTGITTHDKRLQKGLDPRHKAERVRRYAEAMHKEIGIIAHSCGVPEPRRLRRFHCRIVQDDGRSIPLDELYPDVPTRVRAA